MDRNTLEKATNIWNEIDKADVLIDQLNFALNRVDYDEEFDIPMIEVGFYHDTYTLLSGWTEIILKDLINTLKKIKAEKEKEFLEL